MGTITAFADEFGNNSFEFDTQGTHFIVAAVIVNGEDMSTLDEQIQHIRKKHKFQTGELKSSKVGKNHTRRLAILEDLVKLDLSVYAVIIDKRELYGEGFTYKKSFYKFLNNLLYKEMYRTFPRLDLYVDEHGGNDFMKEFRRYVEKNHSRNLFAGSDFNILASESNHFIQVADFVAGTLGYIYDELKQSDESKTFMRVLSKIISSIDHFPRRLSFADLEATNIDESFDKRIAEVSFLRIESFLDNTKGDSRERVDQIVFLKLLLWLQRATPYNRYISTKEIFSHLNHNRQERMQEEYFRSKVIGNLRDNGILIASSRKGYKIPTSVNDLNQFITHGSRIIQPMIGRIKLARDAIKLATKNELDLLDRPEYEGIKKLIDSDD